MPTTVVAPALQPSLLERDRAAAAQSACTVQRALGTLFGVAAGLLFIVSMSSGPAPAPAQIRRAPVLRKPRSAVAATTTAAASPPTPSLRPPPPSLRPPPPPPPPSLQPAAAAGVADPTCHARLHTDYMGERAPVWGLGNPGFHLKDAGECCKACQAHAAVCGQPGAQAKSWWPARPELKCGGNPGCNIWVYCPEEQCFAFDIHVHTKGECWLKQQRSPGGATNLTRPKDPHEGHTTFPAAMRKSPRKLWPWAVDPKIWAGGIPEHVPWISGVLAPADAVVHSAPADDQWRKRWCDKHGPTYGGCG